MGLLLGTALAPLLTHLPLATAAALLALALALRNAPALFLAAAVLGLLNGTLHGPAPPRLPEPPVELSRPLEIVGRTTGHPISLPDHHLLRVRTESLRQRQRIAVRAVDLWLTLPPGSEPPAIGSKIRFRGYLRRSAGFANGPPVAARPGPWRMRLKSARFLALEAPGSAWAGWAAVLRRRAEGLLEPPGGGGARAPALIRALVLGDRSQLPKSWQQALRRCGLAHLLAVSGLHIALVTLLLLSLGTPLPPRGRVLFSAAGIAVYLLLVGPRPSVLRASAMGLLAAAALVSERPPQALNALACGVAVLVLWDPAMVAELGFQLSVAATGGILLLAPVLSARWRLPPWLRRPLAVSLAAQAATLPWTLPLVGGAHPLAPLFNLVAIPWLACFLLAAFSWLAAASLSSSAAGLVLPVLEILAAPLDGLASVPPSAAFLRILPLDPALSWLLAAALIAAACRPALLPPGALVVALLLLTGAGRGDPRTEDPGTLPELTLLDVGQGDAVLIRDGSRAALIDGGGWPEGDFGGRVLLPVLAAAGVDRLAALALTHPDVDHCAGLVDLARYLPVAEVWMAPGWTGRPCAEILLTTPGTRWRVLFEGERARLGRWRIDVLHPYPALRHSGENERSLVLRAEVFGRRALLAGDIESQAERRLVGQWDLRADVLKVAHHGSKTSTTPAFLSAVRPRLALVSAGSRNPYGHPHPTVVERLASAGARVLRTDRSGRIRLRFHTSGRISIAVAGKRPSID